MSWKFMRGKNFRRQINIICTSVIWPVAEICRDMQEHISSTSKITNNAYEATKFRIIKNVFKMTYTCDNSHKNNEQSTVQTLLYHSFNKSIDSENLKKIKFHIIYEIMHYLISKKCKPNSLYIILNNIQSNTWFIMQCDGHYSNLRDCICYQLVTCLHSM